MVRTNTVLVIAIAATLLAAEAEGTAVVQVRTSPDIGEGTFRFTGTPAGELTLAATGQTSLTAASLASGSHVSTLAYVDPMVVAAGYTLTQVHCDDEESAEPSTGDVQGRSATFRIEGVETVTCVFEFSVPEEIEASGAEDQECVCPKQGPWKVANHRGEMACTGSFAITRPLKPSRSSGSFEIRDDCTTIIASGLSEDEATIEMHRVPGCGYKGTVGGSSDGIPMTIEFTWEVHTSERITGDLQSTFSKDGMTCEMSRDYELTFGR